MRRLGAWALVLAGYTLMTLVYLRPVWRVGGGHVAASAGDPVFNLYVLKWSARQIRLGIPDLWNANLFHPNPGALTYSDHLLGPAAQIALFPNAVAGYNFLFVTSFIASALAVCWVCRRAGLSWIAAVLAGWMFAFSPYRLSQMTHIQVLLAQWVPLTLWFWDRLLAERTWKNAGFFLLFYLLNLAGGCYLAYMVHFAMLALLANRLRMQGREIVSARSLRVLAPVVLAAAGALIALFLPYLEVSRSQGLVRTDADIAKYGATLASYFRPTRDNLYFGPGTRDFLRSMLGSWAKPLFYRMENALFAGILPTALFLVGAVAAWRKRDRDPWGRGLALVGILCFLLTFPLVYAPLMRVVPGLSGMRVPTRFYVFVSLALAYFAARGVDVLREKVSSRAAVSAGLLVLLALEMAPRPVRWHRLPREQELPPVYLWIAREPSVKAIVELPIYEDSRETQYLYASTVHWKPLANGYSGYRPASHRELARRVPFVPDEEGFGILRRLGVSHLVVHARKPGRARALREWERQYAMRAELVFRDGTDSVYRLLDSSSAPNRAGLWKSAGRTNVGDQPLNSGSPSRGRSMR